MRRFHIIREIDHTGVSGTGIVAEGIEFTDKSVVVHWVVSGKPRSTVIYRNIHAVEEIHDHKSTAHEGGTSVVFIDN